jgi:hypothetical protein
MTPSPTLGLSRTWWRNLAEPRLPREKHLLGQPQLAELPHERRAVAGQDDGQDRLGIRALQARKHRR